MFSTGMKTTSISTHTWDDCFNTWTQTLGKPRISSKGSLMHLHTEEYTVWQCFHWAFPSLCLCLSPQSVSIFCLSLLILSPVLILFVISELRIVNIGREQKVTPKCLRTQHITQAYLANIWSRVVSIIIQSCVWTIITWNNSPNKKPLLNAAKLSFYSLFLNPGQSHV